MNSKRNLTPIVPAPDSKPSGHQPSRRRALKAPILVVAAGKEWELEQGVLVIGRDPDSNVELADPLVSRLHARLLTMPDGQVVVEDLKSANGVFINGSKLSRPMTPLCEGDRLLLGTTEISVFSLRSSATVQAEPITERRPSQPRDTLPSASTANRPQVELKMPRRRQVVTTARGAPIDMIAEFAQQLMDSGQALKAVGTLSEPLQNLLKGISAGLSVPPPILESATRYALRLRSWTQRDSWVEYVLELHLACRQVPSDQVCSRLEAVVEAGAVIDRTLARFLVATIEGRPTPPTPEEQLRLRRIERMGK